MSIDSLLLSHRQFVGHTEYAGIDKIRISFPLYTAYSDGSADLFTKRGVRKTLSRGSELEYAKGAFPGRNGETISFEIRNNASIAVIEFNPSRSLDPGGSTLCHPKNLEELIVEITQFLANNSVVPVWMVEGAGEDTEVHVHELNKWHPDWRKMVRVSRLDIARDFFSPFKSFDLKYLAQVKIPYFPKRILYLNKAEIETISWGKRNNVRHNIYNRSKKHQGDANGGWYRFEIQVATHCLKGRGMNTLEGLNETSIYGLLWHRWEVSNMDSVISAGEDEAKAIQELSKHLTGVRLQTFIGLATSFAKGYPVDMNPRKIQEYREIGQQCGFLLGQPLESIGGIKIKVDFAKGEVVLVEQERTLEFTQTQGDMNENLVSTIGETA